VPDDVARHGEDHAGDHQDCRDEFAGFDHRPIVAPWTERRFSASARLQLSSLHFAAERLRDPLWHRRLSRGVIALDGIVEIGTPPHQKRRGHCRDDRRGGNGDRRYRRSLPGTKDEHGQGGARDE
jgi:hypothetical protein